MNYIYSNFTNIDISNIIYEEFYKFEDYFSNNISVQKSTDKPTIKLDTINNVVFPIRSDELNCITSEIYALNTLSSPSFSNKKIGELKIKINNETLLSSNIILTNNINRKTTKMYFKELLINFFNI